MNQRQIKFRAWDNEVKKWTVPFTPQDLADGDFISASELERCEIVEWTGLCDKNGKEIWEGDIVAGQGRPYLIKYGEGHYEFWESETVLGYHWGIWNIYQNLEVIGNIQENKDLLK